MTFNNASIIKNAQKCTKIHIYLQKILQKILTDILTYFNIYNIISSIKLNKTIKMF